MFRTPDRKKTNTVCDVCHDLKLRCSVCGLPVKDGYVKTGDGRIICKHEADQAVIKEADAIQIFEQAREQVIRLTAGAMDLQTHAVKVSLFDIDYWNYKDGKPVPPRLKTQGFSQSRRDEDGYVHVVVLLSGQSRPHMLATCAHEYTHLWINENMPRTRLMNSDTLESICELIAYKIVERNDDTEGQTRIKENLYTNGKILTAIEYENRHGLDAVLSWVKNATDLTLSEDQPVVAAATPASAPASPLFAAAPVTAAPPAPAALELKGMLGTRQRRLALINDRAFSKDELGTVVVGGRKLSVQCVEILDNAVVIKVNGSNQPVTLYLDGH